MEPDFLKFPLVVVAHDAGAANHIIAWLNEYDGQDVYAYLEGPAAALWKNASLPARPALPLTDAMRRARLLLTGTGWASAVEHDARKLARTIGIKSAAVIDHWVNYKQRFVRNGEEVLPDEIWVADTHAKLLAEAAFGKTTVRQLRNVYLEHQVAEIRRIDGSIARGPNANVLYVLEPIRQSWNGREIPGEFQALDYFIQHRSAAGINDDAEIRLKPHPSDAAGKYDSWLRRQTFPRISVHESASLPELIAWSDVIVGCQTYAMVIALAAGKRVVSSIPPWAPACALPQPEIFRLSDLT